jgi:murein DD-endopeptidase MepM/ murein hydrolase activator NlpD
MRRRRARLIVTLLALVTLTGSFVGSSPRDLALAADPISQAKAQKASIEAQLADQRARLASLQASAATLSGQLDAARAALAQVTAEYDRVVQMLGQVRQQVEEITAHLAQLRSEIAALDDQLLAVQLDIVDQTQALEAREALLEDHLRSAYEHSQTSLLEVMLSSDSLDAATNQVGYLLTLSEQDRALADEIRVIREELDVKQATLRDGRRALREGRIAASAEEALLKERQAELERLEARTAELKAAAERKRAEQEAALNAALQAKGDVEAQIAANERAFAAASQLVNQLVAEQAALEEARRRQAEEEARRRAEEAANRPPPTRTSTSGFRWPEAAPRITQEWGPTSFALEPPYTYNGTYYPHFHGGIDMASGCGAPILASKAGVVVASGQPLYPYDTGFGVVLDHGGRIQTWYWHMQPRVIVRPGQIVNTGQVIGYEGTTGFSTGCHLHFAVNDHGVWENPRRYLP